MHSVGKILVRVVLATLVGSLAAAGATACDKDSPAASSATSAAAAPPSGTAASHPVTTGQATRAKAPISGVRADALADDWAAHWHVTLKVTQNELVHVRQATVDYPAGHGRLQLGVQQEGTGSDPAPSFVHCVLRDSSLGEKFVNLTRTLLDRLLADCWGAVLLDGEAKQIADWAMTNRKKNAAGQIAAEHTFDRFAVHFGRGPATVVLTMQARAIN